LGELFGGAALVGLDLLDRRGSAAHPERQLVAGEVERPPAPPQPLAERGGSVHLTLPRRSQGCPPFCPPYCSTAADPRREEIWCTTANATAANDRQNIKLRVAT